jgi:hypothetical protein
MSMLAGVHRVSMSPYAARTRISRTCAGPVDLARVARHPRRRHRLLGDAVEMLGADFDLLQAARHAEAADEASSTSPASSPGCPIAAATSACRSALAGFVPAHHRTAASRRRYGRAARRTRRRAHSRCHGWRPSARPKTAARSKARCRSGNPSARRDRRVGLHPRQRLRQHRQPLQRLGVGIGMRLARADAFDAMIDGADAGRQPQPFRRVHGEPGIEDHRARHHQRMAQHLP